MISYHKASGYLCKLYVNQEPNFYDSNFPKYVEWLAQKKLVIIKGWRYGTILVVLSELGREFITNWLKFNNLSDRINLAKVLKAYNKLLI